VIRHQRFEGPRAHNVSRVVGIRVRGKSGRGVKLRSGILCNYKNISFRDSIRWCIQKFPDWPPGARTANVTALCH
jgi:hypothetical protein